MELKKGYIERIGSDKIGKWKIIKSKYNNIFWQCIWQCKF